MNFVMNVDEDVAKMLVGIFFINLDKKFLTQYGIHK